MQNPPEKEKVFFRTQFQIDRIAFFSDAVIAIGITLLVLEIKIPVIPRHVGLREFFSQNGDIIIQHLFALFICFVAVGSLWMNHHELFEFVTGFNNRLIKTNLYFLFTVIILPLSISFNMDQNNPDALRILALILNLLLCNLCFYYLLYIICHRNNLFHNLNAKAKIDALRRRILLRSVTLFLVCIVSLIAIKWFYLPFSILLINRILEKYKKYKMKTMLRKSIAAQ
jgi:uncharacterized membrane protein